MSLIETTVVVAALGVVAAVTIPALNNVRDSAKASKLSTEASTLNNAVKSFVSSGGEIKSTDTVLEVLDKLKIAMSSGEAAGHVGYTGAFVDARLTGKLIGKDEKGNRVVWDFDQKKFNVTTEAVDGIEAFVMDDNAVKQPNTRKSYSIFRYATEGTNDDWVWEYGTAAPKVVITPTAVTTAPQNEVIPDPILISLVPPVQDTPPDPVVDPDPADPNRLSPPVFSIGGGNHALANYKLPLTIANPNSGTESAIVYRQGGSWRMYEEGQEILVTPDTDIDAYVHSFEPWNHTSSSYTASSYDSKPVQLNLSASVDQNEVGYYQLVNGDVRVRWNVVNLDEYPEYLKTTGFFKNYWAKGSVDPRFPEGRIPGAEYHPAYEGESLKLSPSIFDNQKSLDLTIYSESRDTTWIKHSDTSAVSVQALSESLPAPDIGIAKISETEFRVTLTPSGEMPFGSAMYYNSTGDAIKYDKSSGAITNGTRYSGPFIWRPKISTPQGNTSGTVYVDGGNGAAQITEVVLKAHGQEIKQTVSAPFTQLNQSGANAMQNAAVNDCTDCEVKLKGITVVDDGKTIEAKHVNVLDVKVKNLNFPQENLDRISTSKNGVKKGSANEEGFAKALEKAFGSKDLKHYIKFDGNLESLANIPFDFDITFSPLDNSDYLVIMERYGNSTVELTPINSLGEVVDGSNKLVVQDHSWNTGYAPSDCSHEPMFLTVVPVTEFGVDTDQNSIAGFRINNDGGADFKLFTISDKDFKDRPVKLKGALTAATYPPANLTTWFNPSASAVAKLALVTEVVGAGGVKTNNGHGNNIDGVDVSNPGKGKGGPNGTPDPSGDYDDEKH